MTPAASERLIVEAQRLHERYTVEVVERFDLCPWARPARLGAGVPRTVLLQREADARPTLDLLAALAAASPPAGIVIVIYPLLRVSPPVFDAMASAIKAADQERAGGRPVYVSATFHPEYRYDDRTASALVPWLRRSPDPSLQLVRLDVIEQARGRAGKMLFDFSPGAWEELRRRVERGTVPDRIAADNRVTALRERVAIERAIAAIAADRAASYAALGLEPPAL